MKRPKNQRKQQEDIVAEGEHNMTKDEVKNFIRDSFDEIERDITNSAEPDDLLGAGVVIIVVKKVQEELLKKLDERKDNNGN